MDDFFPFDDEPIEECVVVHKEARDDIRRTKAAKTLDKDIFEALPFWRARIEYESPKPLKPTIQVDYGLYYSKDYDCDINTGFNFVKAFVMLDLRQTKRQKVKSLSVVMTLPFEILFEIFGHLHPIDLYNLGFVSKSMRRTVRSKSALSLWKLVWQRNQDIPRCPPTLSHLRWADLLFGDAICETCHQYTAQPDFVYMTRYCTKCLSHLFHTNEGEYNPRIKPLVPGTLRTAGHQLEGKSHRNPSSTSRLRRVTDIAEVKEKLRQFDAEFNTYIPGAKERLDAFCLERKAQAEAVVAQAQPYERWIRRVYNRFSESKSHQRRKLFLRLKKKVQHEGYPRSQLTEATFDKQLLQMWKSRRMLRITRKLVAQDWDIILQIADSCLEKAKDKARLAVVQCRSQRLEGAYDQFRAQYPASKWHTFPPYEQVVDIPPFTEILQDKTDVVLTPEEFDTTVQSTSSVLLSWFDETRTSIFNKFADPTFSLPQEDFMNLAISLFSCTTCVDKWQGDSSIEICMFGWTDLSRHLRYHEGDVLLTQAAVVRKILLELELDPKTTSAHDLDKLNLRFVCGDPDCVKTPAGYRRSIGRRCFNWRTLVRHVFMRHEDANVIPGSLVGDWQILGPEATEYVIRREKSNHTYEDPTWACNHCSFNITQLETHAFIVDHIQKDHDVQDILNGRDIIHIPRNYMTQLPPVTIPVKPYNRICMVCPRTVICFYNTRGVGMHLRDKHGVQQAEESTHWKVLPLGRS